MPQPGYIVEFVTIGNSIKVSAVDPVSGTEVSAIGSPQATQAQMSALAVRKLEYVLKRDGLLKDK